jgi:hypothetical protein
MRRLGRAGLAGAAAALPLMALACPPAPADGRPLAADGVALAWRVDGAPGAADAVPLHEPFALVLQLCPPQAELRAVDASMPAHRHGMNYRPTLQALGGGRWRAEGLLWHMAGTWELRFDVHLDGRTRVLRQAVDRP